jgi:glycosyl transferase family 87
VSTPTVSPLLRDSRIVLYLFVGLRLMLLLVYQPIQGVGPGFTAFGDFQHYYNLASLSSQGKLPYRDYWYEFPPVFPLLSLTVYSLLSGRGPADFTAYAVLLGLVMIGFDTANLLLVRRIGARLYSDSTGMALAWIYALLAVPLVFSFWTFEPVVVCAVLLAVAWLVEGRDNRSAAAAAFGALTKFFPLVVLGSVWRFRPPRAAIRYTVIAVGLTVLGLLVLLAVAGPFGQPSLLAQFNKASYQSVWALIDHNYKTGNFGPIADHFDPAKAYDLQGNAPVIPAWLRALVFGAIGLFVYARTRRQDHRGIVAFVAITVTIFFLWSQGWSPQWQMFLVPLILLNYPTRDGVLTCLALALISFVEYPLLFSRTAETGGAIAPAQLPIFTAIILLRTALLIGFAVALYRRLRIPIQPAGDTTTC